MIAAIFPMRHARSRLLASKSGSSAVEFALIAPVVGLLLLGMFDFSRLLSRKMAVDNAARAGAEYAVRFGYDSSNIAAAITAATSVSGISATPSPTQSCGCPDAASGIAVVACGTNCPSGGSAGKYVIINAAADYNFLFPWPGVSNPFPLAASEKVRIQ